MLNVPSEHNSFAKRLPLPRPQILVHQPKAQTRPSLKTWMHMALTGLEGSLFLLLVAWLLIQWVVPLQSLPKEWFQNNTLSLRILDRDGNHLHEEPASNGLFGAWLPHKKIPRSVLHMTLAAEDHRIHQHPGVDPWAVLRSLVTNTLGLRKRSGASTLAMQLARLLRPAPRTYVNKIKEMYWAIVLQKHLGVRGVLREYLNRAPYGNRVQGIQRAALLYFDRPAIDLSAGEAAFIAGLPWGPGYLNPFHTKGYKRAKKRAHWILFRARYLGYLTESQYQEALRDPIRIQKRPIRNVETIHFTQQIVRSWTTRASNPTTSYIRPSTPKQATELRTTLDTKLQRAIVKALKERLYQLPKATTGSVLVVDHTTGEVLAYVGSPNYFGQQARGAIDYTRVTRAPGSTLKPFIYAQGIQRHGLTGATLLNDLARSFIWKHGVYRPNNHDSRFLGPIRLRQALGNSRNIPVLHVLAKIGIGSAMEYLKSIGISNLQKSAEHYGLGLALGNAELSLIELVQAYSTLARDGKRLPFKWIRSATDSLGKLLPLRSSRMTSEQSQMRPFAARIIKHILSDPMARFPAFQRHGWLEFPFPVAVKTGTSQGHRDAWLLALSQRIVVGCWVGNHNRRKMGRVYGSKGCGPIVQTAMKMAMKRIHSQTKHDFQAPKKWKRVRVCSLSGQRVNKNCPHSVEEWFSSKHLQTLHICTQHRLFRIDKRNGLLAHSTCPTQHTIRQMFVQLPSLYASWSHAVGIPTPPRRYSPLCLQALPTTEMSLRIRQPAHNARYILDPTIPSDYATIALRVDVKGRPKRLFWYANEKQIGEVVWPFTLRWKLKKGSFTFIVKNRQGSAVSKPVSIWVK